MRVLVTGASGFIGRAVTRALRDAGMDVTVALRRADTSASLPADIRAVAVGDIDGATDWGDALQAVDRVIHLAGIAHQPIGEDAAPRYHAVNVEGTAALARAAAAHGVRRLLFLSSVKVNGEETPERPFRESDAPMPEDIYGRSKWQAEQRLADVAASGAMSFTVLRSPLVYGPGVGGNFANLLRLCDTALPLPFAAIANRRSLIARDNLVGAVLSCLDHPAAANETFLVRDGEDLATPALVRRLRRALSRPARLFAVPTPLLITAGAVIGRSALVRRLTGSLAVDDSKLRTLIGWRPRVGVDAALTRTAEAFCRESNRNGDA